MCIFKYVYRFRGRGGKERRLNKTSQVSNSFAFLQTFTDNLLKYLFFKSNSKFIMAVTITGNWYAVHAG